MAQIAYVDWDGLVYYDGKIKKYILDNLEPTLKDGGIKLFNELIEPSYEYLNYIYTISDNFTTNNWFDAAGRSLSAGTVIKVSEISPSVYRYTIFNEFIPTDDAEKFNYINEKLNNHQSELDEITSSIHELDENIQITYATKDELKEAIDGIEHPTVDLSNYVTKDELEIVLDPITSSISYLNENVRILNRSVGELTTEVNHVDEAIHSLEADILKADYASKEYVSSEIAKAKLEAADVDLSAYYTKTEVNEKIDSLATKVEVVAIESRVADLNTSVSHLNDRALEHERSISTLNTEVVNIKNTAATKEELEVVQNTAGQNSVKLFQIDSDLVDINAKLDTIPTKTSELINDSNFLTEHQSLENYATKDLVQESIESVEEKIPSLDGYATEDWVSEQNYLTAIPDEYAKKADLEGYSKFSGSYNDLTDKPEIPSIAGLATETYVDDAIEGINIPDVTNFATKDELSIKANSILFTTDQIVNNAIGSFIIGDNVNGMTLSEILSKLLNLSAVINPDIPSDGIIADIIKNKTPMYSIDGEGNIVEVSYDEVLIYTAADNTTQPTESGFYQIIDDNGRVIESGYQELSANNPDVPHIIALPKDVDFDTMVTTEVFNTKTQEWVATTLNMSNNIDDIEALCSELGVDISHIDQDVYTLWADLESGPTGSIIRYIIKE